MRYSTLIALTILLNACSDTSDTSMRMIADTVYTNGTIYTVNQAEPWAEAVALKDGKFIAVGTRSLAGIASRGHDQTTHQPVFQG